MGPIGIFPPEIWHMIGNYLTDYKDLQMLSSASNDLKHLLKDLLMERLSAKALPYVIKTTEISLDEVLRLRLVAQSWKKAIDGMFQKAQLLDAHIFDESAKISTFLGKFNDYDDNPFVGSSVNFNCNPYASVEEISLFDQLSVQMMNRFGRFVKRLVFAGAPHQRFGVNGNGELDGVFLKRLADLVRRAQSLEVLIILSVPLLHTGDNIAVGGNDNAPNPVPYLPNERLPIISSLKSLIILGMIPGERDERMQIVMYKMFGNRETVVRSDFFRGMSFDTNAADAMHVAAQIF